MDCMKAIVVGDSGVGQEWFDEIEPGLRAVRHGDRDGMVEGHHGEGVTCASRSYRATIWGQSVESTSGASSWTAAMAAPFDLVDAAGRRARRAPGACGAGST